ncbi:MAG TPA: hypothetical protein VMB85_03940 [Bryobacteraceae bacterium]|nr:hypothetical protein [Bryobacteraceae bacterium]
MTDKQHAHELLDQLAPGELEAVLHLLEVMTDPVARSIASARVEAEQVTAETAAELDKARESIERGQGISHDEIMREFGLTPHS